METTATIEQLVEGIILQDPDLFLVGISITGQSPLRIRVSIDSDGPLDIARCAAVSRRISAALEERQLIDNEYNLEVTSPGVDQPLKFKRQYNKNVGRRIQVSLVGGESKTGVLLQVGGNSILIREEYHQKEKNGSVSKRKLNFQEREIPFDQIQQTKVLVSFKN